MLLSNSLVCAADATPKLAQHEDDTAIRRARHTPLLQEQEMERISQGAIPRKCRDRPANRIFIPFASAVLPFLSIHNDTQLYTYERIPGTRFDIYTRPCCPDSLAKLFFTPENDAASKRDAGVFASADAECAKASVLAAFSMAKEQSGEEPRHRQSVAMGVRRPPDRVGLYVGHISAVSVGLEPHILVADAHGVSGAKCDVLYFGHILEQ